MFVCLTPLSRRFTATLCALQWKDLLYRTVAQILPHQVAAGTFRGCVLIWGHLTFFTVRVGQRLVFVTTQTFEDTVRSFTMLLTEGVIEDFCHDAVLIGRFHIRHRGAAISHALRCFALDMAVKRGAEMRSMLELFATARSVREDTLNFLAAVYAVDESLTGSDFQ